MITSRPRKGRHVGFVVVEIWQRNGSTPRAELRAMDLNDLNRVELFHLTSAGTGALSRVGAVEQLRGLSEAVDGVDRWWTQKPGTAAADGGSQG